MLGFWGWLEVRAQGMPWWVAVLFCGVVIAVCFWVGYFARRRSVLWGGYMFSAGCLLGLAMLQGAPIRPSLAALSMLACAACLSQVGLSVLLFVRSARRLRALREAKRHRKTEYTLPSRRDGYLRERLQTVLSCQEKEERKDVGVCGDYARETVARLRGAGLATVDELRLNELSNGLELLLMKGELTAAEQADLNVLLSSLLKMEAKYCA